MQCTHYLGDHWSSRCELDAVAQLQGPDGADTPWGWVCQQHGEQCIEEHLTCLGTVWTIRPLTYREDPCGPWPYPQEEQT